MTSGRTKGGTAGRPIGADDRAERGTAERTAAESTAAETTTEGGTETTTESGTARSGPAQGGPVKSRPAAGDESAGGGPARERPVRGVPLLFDVVPPQDLRAPITRQRHGRWTPWGYLLPALALATILLVPLALTVLTSLTAGQGPANYAVVLADPEVWPALLHNAIWLALALVVCGLGLGLAWLARDVGPRLRTTLLVVLALPVVTSPLTAGVAHRLMFDPNPSRGMVSALLPEGVVLLSPGWIWLVLGLAFIWQWTGLAFLVFMVGLADMPRDLLRVSRAFGAGPLRRIRTVIGPMLFPTAAVVLLVVLTAAARVFDLVLVGVPGSVQAQVDVVGLFWWRHRDDLGDGRASALAVLLAVLAAGVAMLVLWRLRREWPKTLRRQARRPPHPARSEHGGAAGRGAVITGVLVAVAWPLPLAAVVVTSFRSPDAAATSGWWTGGWSLASYAEAFGDGSFAGALLATAVRGALTAAVVVAAALPAAYALTPGQLSRRTRRTVATAAVVLAVLPPQALAVPLGDVLGAWLGGVVVLSIVHAALALPLAVLLLRNAFMSVPRPVVLRPLAEGRTAMFQMTAESGPAVLAVAVLAFVLTWNDLVIGLLLNWPAADQAPLVVLQQARQFATSAGALAAQTVILTAVPVLLVLASGRRLVRGLTQGVSR